MISHRIPVILAFCAAGLSAQHFEAASVKRAAHGAESGALPRQQDASRINYQGVTLKSVLAFAYGVTEEQIGGPSGSARKDSI